MGTILTYVTLPTTKGDIYMKELINRVLGHGSKDINPRPKYKDGTPAHTISINHVFHTYDISKGESPFITLRPIAIKSAIGELLWIYHILQQQLFQVQRSVLQQLVHWLLCHPLSRYI